MLARTRPAAQTDVFILNMKTSMSVPAHGRKHIHTHTTHTHTHTHAQPCGGGRGGSIGRCYASTGGGQRRPTCGRLAAGDQTASLFVRCLFLDIYSSTHKMHMLLPRVAGWWWCWGRASICLASLPACLLACLPASLPPCLHACFYTLVAQGIW